MKRLILTFCIALFCLTGCGAEARTSDNPTIFESVEYTDYRSIKWGDNEYVPFGSIKPDAVGNCLGYFEEAGISVFVCELSGENTNDWLVTTPDLANSSESMAFRNIDVTVIPDGLEADPDFYWND